MSLRPIRSSSPAPARRPPEPRASRAQGRAPPRQSTRPGHRPPPARLHASTHRDPPVGQLDETLRLRRDPASCVIRPPSARSRSTAHAAAPDRCPCNQVSRRLVGQDQMRFVRQRPRDRNALLLAARELRGRCRSGRPARRASEVSARPIRSPRGTPVGAIATSTFSRAFRSGSGRTAERRTRSDRAGAPRGPRRRAGEVAALELDRADVGRSSAPELLEQRRLAGARRPDDGHEFPAATSRSTSASASTIPSPSP